MNSPTYKAEPEYCENCQHFTHVSPDGEGTCSKDGSETWYGEIACSDFDRKEDDGDG